MRDEAGRKVETAVEARAGFLDRPVLVVLCVSLALGVIVLGALWLGFFTVAGIARTAGIETGLPSFPPRATLIPISVFVGRRTQPERPAPVGRTP